MAIRKKLQRTNVAFVLDDSGSMACYRDKAQQVFNKMIDDNRKEAHDTNQIAFASIVYFGSMVTVKAEHQPIDNVPRIIGYNPRQGSTALFSGVIRAVEVLDEVVQLKKYEDSYLVMVVTDGEENSSGSENIQRAIKLFREKQGEGNWTFVFYLPPRTRNLFCQRYGIPTDNVIEWELSEVGLEHMSSVTSSSLSEYYTARSKGVRSVTNFFVQPDLSKVSTTQIKRQLHDVSRQCQQFTLPKEEVVKDFVEKKTRKPYVLGTAYYQLMKTEKVQPSKGVLLVEKGKDQVWAGHAARTMIGLPDSAEAKVEPGNHANYDIFIQSTSVNRKLPRGTKLIVVDTLV